MRNLERFLSAAQLPPWRINRNAESFIEHAARGYVLGEPHVRDGPELILPINDDEIIIHEQGVDVSYRNGMVSLHEGRIRFTSADLLIEHEYRPSYGRELLSFAQNHRPYT